ncbi:MAG: ATP-dependent DNA helicase RecG [Spirochaetaceae bacterium]|nr:ATP-dependent DNA helicase RecG [Spirochaetaceae bacterium]
MFLRELTMSIDHIKGAGPASIQALANAGILNVAGLISRYPRDWEDRSKIVPLKDFRTGAVCTLVRVLAHDWFIAGGSKTLKIFVEDETARAVLVCFNRSFMDKQLLVGNYYRLWGVFHYRFGEIQCTNFETEAAPKRSETEDAVPGKQSAFGRILPIYPLNTGLSQGMLRKLIHQALTQYGGPLENELPEHIRNRDGLFSKADALGAIHFPESLEELETAKQTLIYEELFYLEILVGRRGMERRNALARFGKDRTEGTVFRPSPLQQRLLDRLPFSLTAGQQEAVADINRDMDYPYPMARLLQGDVGSGKTLVSFLGALRIVEQGGQAAVMAPTELLARQHAENAARLLEPLGIRPAFLTGNVRSSGRAALLKSLAAGEIDVVIGTHALFSRDVVYNNLRLVVIDEQHRFGVVQRQAILAKGEHPHLLMMSATPIPRTLALTVFGDMEVSVIRDLPQGRKPVRTHLARESNETKVYDFVFNELSSGRQAYFVYPLIEADTNRSLKDAETMAGRLAGEVFPQFTVALIHSKLDEEEKRKIMEYFRKGEIQVLVATSVVEVGVDVPNATCMVIEHAERFGLAALHQLRGRVGRGDQQSYCFLVYSDALTEDGKTRLKVMLENADGFVIAEEDLKLRGPGHMTGIEQSGYLILGMADPVRDASRLEQARIDAFSMLEKDPSLSTPEYQCVAQVLNRAPPFGTVGL